MKRYLLILLICILCANTSFSQTEKAPDEKFKGMFEEATEYLYEENYMQALSVLLKLDSLYPNNANLSFNIGYCYLQSPADKQQAIPYLETAVANMSVKYKEDSYKETKAPVDAMHFLADAYHVNYKFDDAIATYEKYKATLHKGDAGLKEEIDRQIHICHNARTMMQTPVEMITVNAGKHVNSYYADYSPVITADESVIIYTSRREGSTGGLLDEKGIYYEDIYISEKVNGEWSEPKKIGEAINSDGHEAPTGLSADGQQLFIYKYEEGTGGGIYFSQLDGITWSEPVKLGADINSEAWESHATISADGQYLSFTSDRQDGEGGRDLYFSKKLPDGTWGLVQNYGSTINTPYDEGSPFLHPDGKTFFFSSKGHNTMGGFDVFISSMQEDGSWGTPQNIGYPVNTTGDDNYYMPTTDGKSAYYSSFRKDGFGEKDIYKITVPGMEEKPLTVYAGTIKNRKGEVPNDIYIEVTDNETGELIGSYMPNSATGKYLFILQPGHNYNITYESEEDCYYHSENLIVAANTAYQVINKSIELDPLETGMIIRLSNIFYKYDKATLSKPKSLIELNKLFDLMTKCPSLRIEISGHTDEHGSDDYNMGLSQRRTQSVLDYLTDKGIDASRLEAKGYGETMPVAPNTHPDGSDNPEGRALNRRTELKVL